MIAKTYCYDEYVGSKALFDPNYLPPEILHRDKERKFLLSILHDSYEDNFGLNVFYQGIKGIGKKVLVNKVTMDFVEEIQKSQDLIKINISCQEKSTREILFNLILKIINISSYNLNLDSIINYTSQELWSLFKILCKKLNNMLLFVFQDVEDIKPKIFKKFLILGKEAKIPFFSTCNKVLKPKAFEVMNEFDIKCKLNLFSYKQLFSILRQRCKLTFSHNIDKEFIEYLTDVIVENYAPIPGKGIEVLKEIYPVLKTSDSIELFQMLEIYQNSIGLFPKLDDFNLISYISEEEMLKLVLLDNITDYFLNISKKYYIDFFSLRELYEVSCESLEYDKNFTEFHNYIRDFQNLGILCESHKIVRNSTIKFSIEEGQNPVYFLNFNPMKLKSIIDVLFGKYN